MASTSDLSKNKDVQQILTEWKQLYTDALIDALHPSGDVLQVGFGLGIASNRILKFKPKSLVIIESNASIIPQMKSWAKKKPGVITIEQEWDKALGKLGVFDTVFFNDDTQSDLEILNTLFPEEMQLATDQTKQVLNDLNEEIAGVKASFSEKDIEDFYQKTGQFKLDELPDFFRSLKENGNISEELYQKTVKKYQLDKLKKAKQKRSEKVKPKDPMLSFLEECLKDHMRKGSKFTAFLKNQVSKYTDSPFFESIILNPNLTYLEETITLKMNDKERKAISMTVEKMA